MDLSFSEIAETIISVVQACGYRFNPVLLLPESVTKFRQRLDGVVKAPQHILPDGAMVAYHKPASMPLDIFLACAHSFILKTKSFRQLFPYFLLILDDF